MRLTKLTIIHIVITALAMLLFSNCTAKPNLSLQAKGFFTLTDYVDENHSYGKLIILSHLESKVMYCKVHHGWENVKAVWENSEYKYFVSKHKKF